VAVGKSTNLESLNLFFNKLSGAIPTQLGNLNRLENLFLHFNELTGTMPSSICDLRDTKNGTLRQLTSDCGIRGRIVCPVDCCTACF
jgi:Leucine-rich repeat (LRR) protein